MPGTDMEVSKTFVFGGQDVRVLMQGGEPWWVASDVCDVLEIKEAHRALTRLDDDEKGRHSVTTPGGCQQVSVVNEPGLYSLILRSRKPQAKDFKRWVTHEVLPSIRQTGSYADVVARPSQDVEEIATRVTERVLTTILPPIFEAFERQGTNNAATARMLIGTPPTCPHGERVIRRGRYGPFWGCPNYSDEGTKGVDYCVATGA